MKKIKLKARLAGISYLLIIVCGIFSHMVVRASLIVKNDAAQTAQNIIENETLFKLSILSDFIMILSYLMLGVLFYTLFKQTNGLVSKILISLNVVGASMMAINMLNQQAALLILDGSEYLSAFDLSQLEALSFFFMKLHSYGYQFAAISYGVWLFPMGYLIIKSNLMPKTIGYFLIIGSIGYTIVFIGTILGAAVPSDITIPADIGEFSLCIFLLIKGVKKIDIDTKEKSAL
ncbi:DUF4386 domain-containing protein [Fusibacter bizertensis]|uniref:DUF4386 domain-containing protein n=1 Tax=Fusibacter bizertensis TaxID=1488331 RepID=A0ABT6NE30_9FIRM|nr:DUF4386 domain-containing protein [Fusibacter bizertensis]MDH8678665.1 DUF4386 domain-containing protein [Fusibacter bizertensis]